MVKINLRSIAFLLLLVALVIVGGVAAVKINPVSTTAAPAEARVNAPTLVIAPSHVLELNATKPDVMIMGSGFSPNQEIRLVISHKVGTISSFSDIGGQLDPQQYTLKANEFGVWGTKWAVGSYSHSRFNEEGLYVLYATDENYSVLASTPFGYYNAKQPYEKWPSWAKAVIAAPATSTKK